MGMKTEAMTGGQENRRQQ